MYREVSHAAALGFVASLGLAACSGGGTGPEAGAAGGGSAGTAHAGSGAAAGAVSSGAGGGASAGTAGSGGAVGAVGGPDNCVRFQTPVTDGPHGLTTFREHQGTSNLFGVSTRVLTFRDGLFYLEEDDVLKTLALDGSAAIELGPAPQGNHSVVGDYYHFSESSTTQEGTVDHWVSPFLEPDNKTQLASSVATLRSVLGEGYLFWEVRGDNAAIWSAPITGGAGAELVPGGQPTGLVPFEGHLYWTDFVTNKLERVPFAGGAREVLTDIPFGGSMVAGFGAVYFVDNNDTLQRYRPGEAQTSVLFSGEFGWEVADVEPVEGGVYFTVDEFCSDLYYASAPGDAQLLVSGFTGFAGIVGVTEQHLYVSDEDAIYRVNR